MRLPGSSQSASNGDVWPITSLIGRCVADRPDVTMVGLEGDKDVYDWDTRRFERKRGLDRIGPVTADWLRTEPPDNAHR